MPIYNDIPVIGKYLQSNSLLDRLSPDQVQKVRQKYWDRIGLGEDQQFSSDAFNNFEKSRITNLQGFNKTLGPDGKPLLKRLHNNPVINKNIEGVLKQGDEFKKAKDQFDAAIADLKDRIRQIPVKYKAEDLIDKAKEIKDNAINAITKMQQKELDDLNELFENNEEFVNALKNEYSSNTGNQRVPASDSDIEVIKNNLVADIKASHQKQLADFKKSNEDSIKTLLDASNLEQLKRDFVLQLFDIEENKAHLDAQAKALNIEVGPDGVKFTGAVLDNLNSFKSLTGKEITRSPDGSYSINMSRNIFSPLYYLDPRQNLQADYRLMMKAAKTSGQEQYNWTFNYSDRDTVMAHARAAYQASIEEGVAPKNIKMKDGSGNEIKLDEAFKDHPKTLKQLHQRAAQINSQKTTTGNAKNQLQSMKQNQTPNTPEPVAEISSQQTPGMR